jgi:hypothetical protein
VILGYPPGLDQNGGPLAKFGTPLARKDQEGTEKLENSYDRQSAEECSSRREIWHTPGTQDRRQEVSSRLAVELNWSALAFLTGKAKETSHRCFASMVKLCEGVKAVSPSGV